MKTPGQIEGFFHEKIPLTGAMGVHVLRQDELGLTLGAPLTLNHNHLGTAFGGSLTALATLCGYGLLWLELGDTAAHIVIANSNMVFKRPVRGDLRAWCRRPGPEMLAEFKKDFSRNGKARIRLRVEIHESGIVAAEFEGKFVALS